MRLRSPFAVLFLTLLTISIRGYGQPTCRELIEKASELSPVADSLTEVASTYLSRIADEIQAIYADEAKISRIHLDPTFSSKAKLAESITELRQLLVEIRELEGLLATIEAEPRSAVKTKEVNEWKDELTRLEASFEQKSKQLLAKLLQAHHPSSNEVFITIRYPNLSKSFDNTQQDSHGTYLLNAYQKFVNQHRAQGWDSEIIEEELEPNHGNVRSVTLRVTGEDVGMYFQHEAGEHRFEFRGSKGFTNTNTVTVNVLSPETKQRLNFPDKDFEVQTARSSGPGGQNVNKVETAVMVKHKASGEFVKVQVHRSQERNRELAFALLRARLTEKAEEKAANERRGQTIAQIGKVRGQGRQVRTYDFNEQNIRDQTTHSKWGIRDFESGRLDIYLEPRLHKELEERLQALMKPAP